MVIETSALVAILLEEPEASAFLEVMASGSTLLLSAVSLLEASLVLQTRKDAPIYEELQLFIEESGIVVVPFSHAHAEIAHEAWKRYGKGRHRASLNFGDCCSYALAKSTGEPLLYKGEDFRHTDLPGVLV